MNDRKLTPAEKQKKLTDLQTAIQKFFTDNRTTADKFTKQTDTDAAKLDVTGFMQKCPQILQDYTTKQSPSATSLMSAPTKFCTDMNTAYNTFQTAIDAQRAKIAA